MKLLGIDEAGRGPVLGSLFIGGVLIESGNEPQLKELGVTDSKLLEASRREEISQKIPRTAEKVIVKEIGVQEIDKMRSFLSLNEIELQQFARVIEESEVSENDLVYIDLPEKNAQDFIFRIKRLLPEFQKQVKIVAEHKADLNYSVVSAASIIAKQAREDHVKSLKEEYGQNIGSGYPSDEDTIKFITSYVQEHRVLPKDCRKTWETSRRIVEKTIQRNLGEF